VPNTGGITDSREEAHRFAENARYQSRLANGLRRREEVIDGTMLIDRPLPTSRRAAAQALSPVVLSRTWLSG